MLTEGDGIRAPCTRRRPHSSDARRRLPLDRLSIAMVGTRGVPARYGGVLSHAGGVGRRVGGGGGGGGRVLAYVPRAGGARPGGDPPVAPVRREAARPGTPA